MHTIPKKSHIAHSTSIQIFLFGLSVLLQTYTRHLALHSAVNNSEQWTRVRLEANLLFKYADDTNLIVPAYSDIAVAQEFVHIKKWAEDNKMIINLNKTKEIVFRRPSIRHLLASAPVSGIEQVMCAKLLGVIFQQNLSFDD